MTPRTILKLSKVDRVGNRLHRYLILSENKAKKSPLRREGKNTKLKK